jgi:hypothetical protein
MPETGFAIPARKFLRLVLALFVVLAGVVSVSLVTQSTASAASCVSQSSDGVWNIAKGCFSTEIPGAHVCADITPGENTAIECTDLVVTDANGTAQMWGEGEFYCQGAHPQCLGMNVKVGFSWTDFNNAQQDVSDAKPYVCNPSTNACPNGGRAMVAAAHDTVFTDCFNAYTWLPAGNVISVQGVGSAYHSPSELDSPKTLEVCLAS